MGYSAWRVPDSGYAIRCCGLGDCYDGSTGWPAGAFLAEYDPEARDGHGEMWWTEDVRRAVSFPDLEGAIECYRAVPANRPVREDGKPDCPLTAYTVEFVDLPDPAPFVTDPARHRKVPAVQLRDELRAAGLLGEPAPARVRPASRPRFTRIDSAVLADCLYLIGQGWIKRAAGDEHGADEDLAAAAALVPDGSVDLITGMIEAGDLPEPGQDPEAVDAWLEACRLAGAGDINLAVTERPGPAPAPPPRQVESEEDFLERLHRIATGAGRDRSPGQEPVSLADDLRKMGLT
jgi:hypothetical protein